MTSAKKKIVITLGILYFVLGAAELLLGWRMNPNGVRNLIVTDRD